MNKNLGVIIVWFLRAYSIEFVALIREIVKKLKQTTRILDSIDEEARRDDE